LDAWEAGWTAQRVKTMKIVEGTNSANYRWPIDVRAHYGRVELSFGGGRGSRLLRLDPSDAKVLAYALLAEAERITKPTRST
jgi:hypothetical protein